MFKKICVMWCLLVLWSFTSLCVGFSATVLMSGGRVALMEFFTDVLNGMQGFAGSVWEHALAVTPDQWVMSGAGASILASLATLFRPSLKRKLKREEDRPEWLKKEVIASAQKPAVLLPPKKSEDTVTQADFSKMRQALQGSVPALTPEIKHFPSAVQKPEVKLVPMGRLASRICDMLQRPPQIWSSTKDGTHCFQGNLSLILRNSDSEYLHGMTIDGTLIYDMLIPEEKKIIEDLLKERLPEIRKYALSLAGDILADKLC